MVLFALAVLAQQAPDTIQLTIDGEAREAIIYRGESDGAPQPVVFAWHGHGGNGRYAARSYKIQDLWPNAIVVYPTGLPTETGWVDPQGKFNGWDIKPSEDNRDLKFFDALYALVKKNYNPDLNRVYAMGHSNGGAFIYTLWAARPNQFAGFASFEAAGARMVNVPKPLFVTIGSQDKIVPPALQQASLKMVYRVDGSSGNGSSFGPKGTLYPGTEPVVFWSYEGGHTFPADAVPSMIEFFKSIK